MTEYFIPTGASETELVEKRSRFLGHVWPVESEGEARARIEEIRKKHYDARHNCWCYYPLDVWAAVPAKSVFGNFGVVRIGGAVLVRKDPVSRSRLVAEFSPAVPGFLRR